jgi:SagB-type dehydrogenase family enzyme
MQPESNPVAWTFHRNTSYSAAVRALAREAPGLARVSQERGTLAAFALPPSRLSGSSLSAALENRFSCRLFGAMPVTLAEIAAALAAGFGMLRPGLRSNDRPVPRPSPSAGGLYPLESYVLARRVEGLETGVYHYAGATHALELLPSRVSSMTDLAAVFLNQDFVNTAAAVLVTVAVPDRTLLKYGDRGYRYLLLEAGHCAQNVNLVCAALGLGCCNIGGFLDRALAALLGVDAELEFPVYAQAIGRVDPTGGSSLPTV